MHSDCDDNVVPNVVSFGNIQRQFGVLREMCYHQDWRFIRTTGKLPRGICVNTSCQTHSDCDILNKFNLPLRTLWSCFRGSYKNISDNETNTSWCSSMDLNVEMDDIGRLHKTYSRTKNE